MTLQQLAVLPRRRRPRLLQLGRRDAAARTALALGAGAPPRGGARRRAVRALALGAAPDGGGPGAAAACRHARWPRSTRRAPRSFACVSCAAGWPTFGDVRHVLALPAGRPGLGLRRAPPGRARARRRPQLGRGRRRRARRRAGGRPGRAAGRRRGPRGAAGDARRGALRQHEALAPAQPHDDRAPGDAHARALGRTLRRRGPHAPPALRARPGSRRAAGAGDRRRGDAAALELAARGLGDTVMARGIALGRGFPEGSARCPSASRCTTRSRSSSAATRCSPPPRARSSTWPSGAWRPSPRRLGQGESPKREPARGKAIHDGPQCSGVVNGFMIVARSTWRPAKRVIERCPAPEAFQAARSSLSRPPRWAKQRMLASGRCSASKPGCASTAS